MQENNIAVTPQADTSGLLLQKRSDTTSCKKHQNISLHVYQLYSIPLGSGNE